MLKAKHLLAALQDCDPETEILVGVHHDMPYVRCSDTLIMDRACAMAHMRIAGRPGSISISNAVARVGANGKLVYPEEPQINTFDIDPGQGIEAIHQQLEEQKHTPTQPVATNN